MERIRGRLLKGDRVVAPTLEAAFEVSRSADGRDLWSGELEVPGQALELELEGVYELVLQDGRRAPVRVQRVRTSLSTLMPTRVNFETLAP